MVAAEVDTQEHSQMGAMARAASEASGDSAAAARLGSPTSLRSVERLEIPFEQLSPLQPIRSPSPKSSEKMKRKHPPKMVRKNKRILLNLIQLQSHFSGDPMLPVRFQSRLCLNLLCLNLLCFNLLCFNLL